MTTGSGMTEMRACHRDLPQADTAVVGRHLLDEGPAADALHRAVDSNAHTPLCGQSSGFLRVGE